MNMPDTEKTGQSGDPLHGVTLEKMLLILVDYYGWNKLHDYLKVRCFENNPSIKSSLTFFRKNNWARTKLEGIYLDLYYQLKREAQNIR